MFFPQHNGALGLDISDYALRIVDLSKKRGKLYLSSFNQIKIPTGDISEGVIKNPDRVVLLINQLIREAKGNKILKKEVIAVLPETKTFIKLLEIPKVEEEKIGEEIKKELKNHLPVSIEEQYLDWQVISADDEKTYILAGVAPKDIVNSHLSLLQKADLLPLAFEIEAVAISRALMENSNGKMIIDIGAARTGLIIHDRDVVQLTVSLPISGEAITREISDSLNLEYKEAEKAKLVCGLDKTRCKGALRKILFDTMDNLIKEIDKAKNYYENLSEKNKISEIVLCGGGAYFLKIEKYLSHRLDMTVSLGNPLKFIEKDNLKQLKFPEDKSLTYTTAIGLAIRGTQKNQLL
ncbi:type IV pilus assembly protein PilM [Candidatus Parcubacteria bacterium]|nr:MAG: type IV pilus assembly protein PilM [Candidatus Parcubacteria bacterium]